MKKIHKNKIIALLLSNMYIWSALILYYVPYALASDSYEEGDRTTHVRVSHPTNEESDLSAEETAHICSLDSIVCEAESDKTPKGKADTAGIDQKASSSFQATISFYSAIDSCHTGASCLMANGKKAQIGYVACPRRYKLGTKVRIDGKIYECGDRTALWVEKKYPNTFDIFVGYGKSAYNEAIKLGRKKIQVQIL